MTASRPRHRAVRAALLAAGSLGLAIAACALPSPTNATRPATASAANGAAAVSGDKVTSQAHFMFDTTRAAAMAPGSAGPRYPDAERIAKIEGEVLAQFVIDSTGAVIPSTLKILRSSAKPFADAVRDALPGMRFVPAEVEGGRKVKALVQTPFTFAISK